MPTRIRRNAARLALLTVAATAVMGGSAHAGTSDLSWSLDQSTTTYPTQWHITIGGSAVDYRWLDTLTKDTVISANSCGDLSPYGTSVFSAGDTSYHRLFNGPGGLCFYVRGRVAAGQGATTTRTGRLSR